tara:strand:- start:264 stop:410 length:147 start_codon:yes stop_codon:yes gene_type:complete
MKKLFYFFNLIQEFIKNRSLQKRTQDKPQKINYFEDVSRHEFYGRDKK